MNDAQKKYLLIACGVLKREVAHLKDYVPDTVELTELWLEQGLHREPERLHSLIMDAIRSAENENVRYDAILLGYGICSRGTVGVTSSRYRIVVPRAHDCITLFLGSKERYLEEFSNAPGTYWYTPGFVSGAIQPGMSEKYAGIYHEFERHYEEYIERFGDETLAGYIIEHQEQAWIKNYTRGAYVKSGLPGGEALRKKARAFCDARGWDFEEISGDLGLILDLLSGRWDDERFLVLEPGERLVIGGVHDIIAAHGEGPAHEFIGEEYCKSYLFDGAFREVLPGTSFSANGDIDTVIGIDAGGTYTDAVVISLKKRSVLASAKSPTTHHDLSIGIKNALLALPERFRGKARRIAISTTLATNAIVEEKGARTGLILIGYEKGTASMVTVGAGDILGNVGGRHDIYGIEIEPFDEEGFIREVRSHLDRGIEAVAISSYLATRNPDHEIRARAIVSTMFDVPVATSHELTDEIDSVRRAHTVLLNARLLPVIESLVTSIVDVVRGLGLPDDIRLVTTEGTLMNTAEALEQPVRLVLSGPAASVKGVRFLGDAESCVLIDMGGTTSDIAVIENGSARRTGRGSTVGHYRTALHAVDIRTVGLGGDSRIAWERNNLTIGPERVIPISSAAGEHTRINENLMSLRGFSSSDYTLVQPGLHFALVRKPANDSFLTERERAIIRFLETGPCSVVELAENLAFPYYSLLGTDRLEKLGFVRRCGLTPTDILVDQGRYDSGDRAAAEALIELYCERSGHSKGEFIDLVWSAVHETAARAILTEVLAGGEEGADSFPGCRYCRQSFQKTGAVDITYTLNYPLLGVGAPAEMLLDGIDEFISCTKRFPENAAVANAVGAASSAGGMHLDLSVIPDNRGRFILYAPDGMQAFGTLSEAKEEAVERSRLIAKSYARRMQYDRFSLDIHVRDRSAPTSLDSNLYIDTSILAFMKY